MIYIADHKDSTLVWIVTMKAAPCVVTALNEVSILPSSEPCMALCSLWARESDALAFWRALSRTLQDLFEVRPMIVCRAVPTEEDQT